MALTTSVGARKRHSTKPSRTPFRRPIRFHSSSRRRAGRLSFLTPFIQRRDTDPKPVNEVFEKRDRVSYRPFGRGRRCGSPYSSFPAIGTLLVVAEIYF